MCTCGHDTTQQPMPGDVLWWAYLHDSGKIQVKRWNPPRPGSYCDLCHAKEEKKQGNDLIKALVPLPIWGTQPIDAREYAIRYFIQHGHITFPEPELLPEDPSGDRFKHII